MELGRTQSSRGIGAGSGAAPGRWEQGKTRSSIGREWGRIAVAGSGGGEQGWTRRAGRRCRARC